MFGVLRPQPQSFQYRRLYARLCQHYRASYGLRALFWLNYETVFLYAIASDLGLLPTASIKDQQCCRLRRDPALTESSDRQLGSLLASIGLLLGSLKVDDDLRDEPGFAARLKRVVFQAPFRRAREDLILGDPDLHAKLAAAITAQTEVETQVERPSLEAFCQPTVSGFVAIFDLLARQLDCPAGSRLIELATPIARAVVSFDQGIDFERDRQGAGYTVLSCQADQIAALDYAYRQIEEAHSTSTSWLGPHSLAAEVLAGFRHRVECFRTSLQRPVTPQFWRSRLAPLRTFYWALLVLLTPTSAMAQATTTDDDWCTGKTCCCFCLGLACGEGSSKARK